MNFGEIIKKEILSKNIKEKHCRKAFIAGIIRGTGKLFEKNGELGLEFSVTDEETAMFMTSNFKSLFGYDVREVSVSEDRLNKRDRFVLSITGDKIESILQELDILITENDESAVNLKLYGKLTEKECCIRAFIRGLFVAVGGCTLPSDNEESSTGYHLEMVFSHYTPALETSEKLAEFGVLTKITRRKENFLVYIKSAEEIKDFIAFLPAPVSVLKITDLIINRELTNKTNRQKNCDLANLNKTVDAAAKHLAAIERIEKTIGIETLKKDLAETAFARKENPDETMAELAERLGITKSCLNHRLRKIVVISNEL